MEAGEGRAKGEAQVCGLSNWMERILATKLEGQGVHLGKECAQFGSP